jgi:hypothetical protein
MSTERRFKPRIWKSRALGAVAAAGALCAMPAASANAAYGTPVRLCQGHDARGYARVPTARPNIAVRLVANRPSFSPGETVYFRLENVGATSINMIGEPFAVERYSDGRWVRDPATPDGFRRKAWGLLRPGRAGPCQSVSLPTEMAPGRYRISKEIRVGQRARSKYLTAEFRVAS